MFSVGITPSENLQSSSQLKGLQIPLGTTPKIGTPTKFASQTPLPFFVNETLKQEQHHYQIDIKVDSRYKITQKKVASVAS